MIIVKDNFEAFMTYLQAHGFYIEANYVYNPYGEKIYTIGQAFDKYLDL